MNFTCNECNDSGSRDKLGTYLDCNACGTAATRRDLNDFVKSLGPTHPEDVALAIHQRALAMVPKQEAPKSMAFIGLTNSDQFKYVLEQLATGQPNPKERRRLVREVRDAIKLCAASQIKESAETLSVRDWIKVEDRLPEPYEEVRILFDGVPRIARLCHNRQYFQLATFIDSTKSQYIAIFDKVDGWMPIALAPTKDAAPAAANGAMPELPPYIYGRETSPNEKVWTETAVRAILAAAGPDTTLIKAINDALDDSRTGQGSYGPNYNGIKLAGLIRAALSGAKGN